MEKTRVSRSEERRIFIIFSDKIVAFVFIFSPRNLPSEYFKNFSNSGLSVGSPLEAKVTASRFPSISSIIFLKSSKFIYPMNPLLLFENVLSF